MRHLSTATKLLASAALPLALVACSSGSTSTKASASTGATSAAAKDPNAGLLTGTQLKKALAPATFFAAGFASDSSATRDTGDTYSEPSVAAVSKPDCTKLDGTSWIALTGIDGVSFAQGDYINKSTSAEIAQEIDVYRGTTAKKVIGAVVKLASACPSFTDSQTSSKVKVSEHSEAGLGDEAYTITLTDSSWQSGTTLTAARVGTAVVSVLSSSGSDNGAAAAKKLTGQIVSALKGKA
ncbi:hypothetical protein [Actinacidiphila oryziradicis]|uniref:PknH-like extracellular domain-containing protein n=1 Tax=Actinacidiphila oryziradicis TaxID=2571141 RepID=A0A4U0SP01_9ACTN|nr:hypothetical protein [Actinacidiphila oryziradicis]TKA10027.1 hypothetical protein FCI23_19020 [Actinacidiphila oryziradicis]